jgi:hypothetical protein
MIMWVRDTCGRRVGLGCSTQLPGSRSSYGGGSSGTSPTFKMN